MSRRIKGGEFGKNPSRGFFRLFGVVRPDPPAGGESAAGLEFLCQG